MPEGSYPVIWTATGRLPLTVMQRTDGTDDPIEQRADWFSTVDRWAGEPIVREPTECADLWWYGVDRLPGADAWLRALGAAPRSRRHLPMFSQLGFERPADSGDIRHGAVERGWLRGDGRPSLVA